jgi:acyl carrier protein
MACLEDVNSDRLTEEVKQFIAREVGVKPDHLTLTTRLMRDLHIDGADGWELVEAFAEKFKVDISQFEPARHFGPEAGCNPIMYVAHRIFLPEALKSVQITVGDLVDAARSRKWQTPARAPE